MRFSAALLLPVLMPLEHLINASLAVDEISKERLQALEGQVILIHETSMDVRVAVAVVSQQVQLLNQFDGIADVTLSGHYTALLALAKSPDALYGSGIRIEGELGIAETLRTLVTQLDIDLESLIAPVVGGTAAHQANRLTDSVANWLHRSADALQQNTKEYLQEEAQLVPPKVLHHEFSEQVSDLREGVDRAEARLRRLEQRISSAAAAKTKP